MSHLSYRSDYYRVRHLDARPIFENHGTVPEYILTLPDNRLLVVETLGTNESLARVSVLEFWKCGTHWKVETLDTADLVTMTAESGAGAIGSVSLFRVDDERILVTAKQSTDSVHDGYGTRFYSRIIRITKGSIEIGGLKALHDGDFNGFLATLDYASIIEPMRAHEQETGTSYALVYAEADTNGVSTGEVRHIGVTGSGIDPGDITVSAPATWSPTGQYNDIFVRGSVGSFNESDLVIGFGEYAFVIDDFAGQGRNLMLRASWSGASWDFGPVSELDSGFSMRNQFGHRPTIEDGRIAFVYTWYAGTDFRHAGTKASTRSNTATYVVPVTLSGGDLVVGERSLLFEDDGDNEIYEFAQWGGSVLFALPRYQPSDGTLRLAMTELRVDPQDATSRRRIKVVTPPDPLSPTMNAQTAAAQVINLKMALVRYISLDYNDDHFTHYAVVERPYALEGAIVEDVFIDTEFDRRYSYQPEWLAG